MAKELNMNEITSTWTKGSTFNCLIV